MSERYATLNVFQKTQRLWDTIHPYNAGQAMELSTDVDSGHVATAFNDAVRDLGLGVFVCDGKRYSIERNADEIDIARPTGGFESHMTGELNRSFDASRSLPFRPFDLVDNGRRFIGLTYQHWVADSVSIRLLMRQWLRRLTGTGGPCPVRLPSSGLLADFGPGPAGWSVLAQTASLLGFASRMKWMRRVESKVDASAAVLVRDGPDELIDAVKARVKREGATVGDAFLAAAASACDTNGASQASARRPDLCMGTIVDLRARAGGGETNVFGLYLAFTMTPFAAAELADPARLLARTARERRAGVARRSAEASQLNMAIGYALGRTYRPTKLREFYRKRFPLAGGLSSVNMTPGWAGEHHPSPLAAYHRVSPTGPMLPLVLTPTTLGKTLRVCCTYRTALMDRPAAERLLDAFIFNLTNYAS